MEIVELWMRLVEVVDHGEVGIGVFDEFESTLVVHVGIVIMDRGRIQECFHLLVESGSV